MDRGKIYLVNMDKDLEVHVDADFAEHWDKENSENTDTSRFIHSFVVSYNICPTVWKSSL